MYQNKINDEAVKALNLSSTKFKIESVFSNSDLKPLSFQPEELDSDAVFTARDILSKRSDDEIITLSKSVTHILSIGEKLLNNLSWKQLLTTQRVSFALSEGRSLYILIDLFDLSTLGLKKLQWSEMFAVLVLMQCAEIKKISIKTYSNSNYDKQAQESGLYTIQEYRDEIIDAIARAECLSDFKTKEEKGGKKGGLKKAEKIIPLKEHVKNRYAQEYSSYTFKKAAEIIEQELKDSNSPLLNQSKATDKVRVFEKWIGQLRSGDIQLSAVPY